jgi:hypothetical protein
MNPTMLSSLAAGLAASLVATPAFAQPTAPTPSTAAITQGDVNARAKSEGERPWNATLDFSLNHAFRADLSDGPGKVGVTRGSADLSVIGPIAAQSSLLLKFGTEISAYDFKDATRFAASGEPWDTIHDYFVSAGVTHEFDENWSAIGVARVRSTGESGADFGDTLTYGGFVGATYAFSKSLRVGVAAGISTQLEDSVQFLPLPSVFWKIDDEWTLDFGSIRGVSLAYKPSDQWKFWGFFDYNNRSFRLENDNAAASNGVGRDRSFNAAINATWSPTPRIDLTASAGYIFGQQLILDNQNGDRIVKDDVDATPFIGIAAEFKF